MVEFCWEFEIHYEETAPYTSEQNDVLEWINKTIYQKIHAILIEIDFLKKFWTKLACIIIYIKNQSSIIAFKKKIFYKALYN